MSATLDQNLIIGSSPAINRLRADVEELSRSNDPVLVVGETGTGKELVARALHVARFGRNENTPFHHFSCFELEGRLGIEGFFSPAVWQRRQRTKGGTIHLEFVDEVGRELQGALMTLDYFGSRARITASASRELIPLAEKQQFNGRLAEHFGKHVIRVPPLRERLEDVPLLVEHFAEEFVRDHAGRVTAPIVFSDAANLAMTDYSWKHNVRNLRSIVLKVLVHSLNEYEAGEKSDLRVSLEDLKRIEKDFMDFVLLDDGSEITN